VKAERRDVRLDDYYLDSMRLQCRSDVPFVALGLKDDPVFTQQIDDLEQFYRACWTTCEEAEASFQFVNATRSFAIWRPVDMRKVKGVFPLIGESDVGKDKAGSNPMEQAYPGRVALLTDEVLYGKARPSSQTRRFADTPTVSSCSITTSICARFPTRC